MNKKNYFNLIDEPWIPVADTGRVSLKQIFCHPEYRSLGGNPVQKIALMKLLLAIIQAAWTPEEDQDWSETGSQGMAQKCLKYLQNWHNCFFLYGDKPFLQLPAIKAAKLQEYGAVLPEISTGNTTVLLQSSVAHDLSDAERAVLLIVLMGFALGGKKTDNSVVLSTAYTGKNNAKGKPSTAKPGPALAFKGLIHSFLQANSLLDSLWLNVLTQEQINNLKIYPAGMGKAPWEQMPSGENDAVAQQLQQSYMGRLLPLCRFCLLAETGLHYSEGIAHPGYKEGMFDPSMAVNFSKKETRVLWVNVEKRPWRELTALLEFMGQTQTTGFDCHHLHFGLLRARTALPRFGIWSAGLGVSSNAGEQYVSGADDFVESLVTLESQELGEIWYEQLKTEILEMEKLAKTLYATTLGFFKSQNMEGKKQAGLSTNLFWQLCERKFQQLLDNCDNPEKTRILRKTFAGFVYKAYDSFCPKDTARQLDAWAENRPRLVNYLK